MVVSSMLCSFIMEIVVWRVQCGDHLISIHVVNGVYYLNGKFEEEKQFCRNRLNVNYNPEAPKPEMWLKYLKDLVEEAGVDAVRYFFVSRAADTHMDFDIDMAKKQTNENPVYYAQYAHARMCSILRSGEDITLADHYERITHEKELDLLKHINEFASTVADAAKTRRLAQLFHTFYADCKVLDRTNLELSAQRLALVKASEMTLRNALTLIGVSAPEKM